MIRRRREEGRSKRTWDKGRKSKMRGGGGGKRGEGGGVGGGRGAENEE